MSKHTTNNHYDIQGMEMTRVARVLIMWKCLRLDDISGKPRLRDVLGMVIHHRFGGYISIVTVKYERRWMEFLRKFRYSKALVSRRLGLYRDKILGKL